MRRPGRAGAVSRPSPGAASRTLWRSAVLLVTLLAFWWQSQLTQTHLHSHFPPHSAAYSARHAPAKRLAIGLPSPASPTDCPICRELAQAGHYLPPPPVAFSMPRITAPWLDARRALASACNPRSHAWQSRAPPAPIQT